MARGAAPRHTGAMKTVYLVEDAPLVRQRLLELLEGVPDTRVLGISARAGDAIREILAERPDVVIVDLHLAEGSGFDVLRAVHEAAPEIAVYVLTRRSWNTPWRASLVIRTLPRLLWSSPRPTETGRVSPRALPNKR